MCDDLCRVHVQGPETESFWRSVCEGATMHQDDREFVAAMATSMVLLHASAFERRVVLPLQQWPLLILRFAQHPAHLCVDARKSLAHALLIAAPGDIDVNSRKFRDAFRHDLRHVQDHGMVPDRLSKFLNGLKSFYRADVRDCEKTNKVISLLLERCPRIGDDLLSSRVALKHYLGETGAGAGFQHKKWSDFRPVAEGLKQKHPGMHWHDQVTDECHGLYFCLCSCMSVCII